MMKTTLSCFLRRKDRQNDTVDATMDEEFIDAVEGPYQQLCSSEEG
jgi:hypothetical protein